MSMEKKVKPAKGRIKELWQIRKDIVAKLMEAKSDPGNEDHPHRIVELRERVVEIDREIQSYSHNYIKIK